MAIKKSAKKVIRSSEKKAVFNLRRTRAIQTVEKQIKKLLAEGKNKEAKELIPTIYKKLDKAAKMGTLKENTASRRKAKFSRMVDKTATNRFNRNKNHLIAGGFCLIG